MRRKIIKGIKKGYEVTKMSIQRSLDEIKMATPSKGNGPGVARLVRLKPPKKRLINF